MERTAVAVASFRGGRGAGGGGEEEVEVDGCEKEGGILSSLSSASLSLCFRLFVLSARLSPPIARRAFAGGDGRRRGAKERAPLDAT